MNQEKFTLFMEKVRVRDKDSCWEWQAETDKDGYGQFYLDGGCQQSHRVMWRISTSDSPGDDLVLHHCDNPTCVNPNHLYLGDKRDNMKDAIQRGQWEPTSGAGEDNNRAKLNESDVAEIKTRLEMGHSHKSIAEDYPTSASNISSIATGDTWEWVDHA
jgi:hypothetical protein